MENKLVIETKNNIVYHPATYITDYIEDMEITKNHLAKLLELDIDYINRLVNGNELITEKISQKLEKVTGISSQTWLNLQYNYNDALKEKETSSFKDLIDSFVNINDFSLDKNKSFDTEIITSYDKNPMYKYLTAALPSWQETNIIDEEDEDEVEDIDVAIIKKEKVNSLTNCENGSDEYEYAFNF